MAELHVVKDDTNPYENHTLPELITLRKGLDVDRAAAAKRERDLKAEITQIDEVLLDYHFAHPEVAILQEDNVRIAFNNEVIYQASGEVKIEFAEWVRETGNMHLLTWHINNAAAREYVSLYGELPHAEPFERTKVSMTAAKSKK